MRNNYLDIKKKEREVSPLHTNSLFRRNDGNRKSALKYQSNNNCYRQNPPINEKPTSKTFKKKKDTFITSDIFPQLFVPVQGQCSAISCEVFFLRRQSFTPFPYVGARCGDSCMNKIQQGPGPYHLSQMVSFTSPVIRHVDIIVPEVMRCEGYFTSVIFLPKSSIPSLVLRRH